MATITWLNGNGATGDWFDPGQWSGNSVPGATDTAEFATGGSETVTTSLGFADVGAILVGSDSVTLDGQFNQDTAGGAANFLTAGASASVTLASNGALIGSGVSFDPSALLVDEGQFIDNGGGTVGTLIVADDPNNQGFAAAWSNATALSVTSLYVQNGGSFTGDVDLAAGGNITLDNSASISGGTVNISGSGTFYVANGPGGPAVASEEEAFSIATGAILQIGADLGTTVIDTSAVTGGGVLSVAGAGQFQSGVIELAGANTFSGGVVIDGGVLSLIGNAGGTGPIFLQNDGALSLEADSTGASWSGVVVASNGRDTVDNGAGTGHLTVFGPDSGYLAYIGGSAASTVVGNAGVLFATAGAGDVIFGGSSGVDQITGGAAGAATLAGGANGGVLNAIGANAVLLAAGGGNTTLNGSGGSGADLFFGAAGGNTVIEASTGQNTIVGGADSETIYTNRGGQTIFLGAGQAQIDLVNGFGGGISGIVGFTSGNDTFHLTGYGTNQVADALASATVSGGNTEFVLADNTRIVVFGVTNLSAGNFV